LLEIFDKLFGHIAMSLKEPRNVVRKTNAKNDAVIICKFLQPLTAIMIQVVTVEPYTNLGGVVGRAGESGKISCGALI
jgi:hypothetical protein